MKKFNKKIKIYTFDSFFDLKNEKISNYLKKKKIQILKIFVIFNYANSKDIRILEKFAKNKKCDVLNINFEKKNIRTL